MTIGMIAACAAGECAKCVKMIDLLTCPKAKCAAWCLIAIAFVAGLVTACVLCKVCRAVCGKKPCGCGAQKGAKHEEKPFQKRQPHPAPADGSIEIYVGNLSYDMTEDQLRKEFEAFGKVNSARLITNKFNGKSKGFGFVHMPNRGEVEAACAALNDKEILGRKIKCNVAKNVAD